MELINILRHRLAQASLTNLTAVRTTLKPSTLRIVFRTQERSYSNPSWLQWEAIARSRRSSQFARLRNVRWNSSKPSPDVTPNLGSPQALSMSQRFKKLSREYGWSAVGVYFALSALDFPFCFLGVRMLGTERIGHWEHVVIESFWKVVEIPFPNVREKSKEVEDAAEQAIDPAAREGAGWGVEEAEARNSGSGATIWTQLALAYAIHKSFIFIRVPLTAAVTPKVVKTLRSWGWNIGKRKPKTPGAKK